MVLSWGFMLVFTAFQTMGNIEKTVLQSIRKENPSFTGEAYTSFAIIYAVFASCNWLAPSYISMTGPRVAILTGACCYVLFIGSFLYPHNALLYGASCILGLGAALIWTGHGQYLTENSDSETMSRNAGIFWAIFQTSMFIGNFFVYFMFTDPEINASTRTIVFSVLTALAIIGMCVLATLRRTSTGLVLTEAEGVSSADRELQIPARSREKPLLAAWNALTDAFGLFVTPKMLLLSLTFVYTGLVLTFYSGVYSSCIGFTKALGEPRKRLVGLSGIFIGIGEVVGGAIFGIFASKVSRVCGTWTVVLTGFCVHLFAFISIFVNLPNDSPFKDTDNVGFISPSQTLAMAGSLALGFGDACFNTQVYSLLGVLFVEQSAPAFALFKFCQSVAAAVSFAYSSSVKLHIQLLILTITIVIGTVAFCYVVRVTKKEQDNATSENDPTLVTE
ncbi:UNC93-like protein MFSD11 [Dufourea novaeangliae]|uniref:UNC93-like protein MFSD11 n=2 Tax=Dufourea novaeangliae TaxID=178035 RepID=A0A154P7Y3_DUFNO|nr:UNC93-like protein MFSD11 [Dufourea novaeangliae]